MVGGGTPLTTGLSSPESNRAEGLSRTADEIITGRNPQDDSLAPPMIPNPLALIAEITHRCPLHCVYCSNPLELAAVNSELSTEEWIDVLQQAGKLGMLHAHFTGGEPLARPDLTELLSLIHI